jgi:phosphoribosylaminoimidazolecarboxamide formyltransferase/IMP cyclohydrolase
MENVIITRALISVSDKCQLGVLARELDKWNIHIISSGGTASYIRRYGVPAVPISEYVGSSTIPEILEGRVKSFYPEIFGGILARSTQEHQSQLRRHGIRSIDLVVANLYPFENDKLSDEKRIEMIDVGGHSLIRAAAKNYENTAVIVNPDDYKLFIRTLNDQNGSTGIGFRKWLASKAFSYIALYDVAIAKYFNGCS